MPSLFSIRPDAARTSIRRARTEFEHARHCATDVRGHTGEPAPRCVADAWRRLALQAAQDHRNLARRAIIDAWPLEWQRERRDAA